MYILVLGLSKCAYNIFFFKIAFYKPVCKICAIWLWCCRTAAGSSMSPQRQMHQRAADSDLGV